MNEKEIGNYRILEQVGSGGMARVYLAVHKDVPNLKVVLKIVSDKRLVERFKQEADKLALLSSNPNICQIKHFFNHGDEFVIAMEHIEGPTLDQKIKDKGRLPVAEAVAVMIDVLSVLEMAHGQGIFHRDIKPGNIMFDKSGMVKIIDFGIAKAETDPNLTVAGSSTGTPLYMAPEQFTPSDKIDYSLSDIYSVGSTLFLALTGEHPFDGDNEFALRDAKLFHNPKKLTSFNKDVDKKLEQVILKSLKKEPGERFSSASEMIEALKPFKDAAPSTDSENLAKTRSEKISIAPASKKSKNMIFVAAAVIVIAAILYFFNQGGNDGEMAIDTNINEADTIVAEIVEDTTGTDNQTVAPSKPIVQPFGKVDIMVRPFGDIYFDDRLTDLKSRHVILSREPGQHIIRIENEDAEGEKIYIDTIEVVSNETVFKTYDFDVTIYLPSPRQQAATMPDSGKLLVGSMPRGADIYIDGTLQDQKTPYTFNLTTGEHIVHMTLNIDGQVFEKTDTTIVKPGGHSKVLFKP